MQSPTQTISPHTATPTLETDITLDAAWQAQQVDIFLGFEILQHALNARYQPLDAAVLADKVALDKGIAHRIVKKIQSSYER